MRPTETSGSAENVRDISGRNTISIDSSSHWPTSDLPDQTQSDHHSPLTSEIGTGLQEPGSSPFHQSNDDDTYTSADDDQYDPSVSDEFSTTSPFSMTPLELR